MVQHGRGDALCQHDPADNLPVAPEAGNDDRCILLLCDFLKGRAARTGKARQQQAVYRNQHQGAQQHGNRDRANQQRRSLSRKHVGSGCGLKHDKCELTPLGQQQGEHRALGQWKLDMACQGVDHGALHRQKAEHHEGHRTRGFAQNAKVDAHAHCNKKQPEQQTLEGLQVGLQLAPVLAVCEQHTRQKGAQGHAQADQQHQGGDADHQQQGGCGEDLWRVGACNPAKQGAQQQAPTQDDAGDDCYDFNSCLRIFNGR